MYSDLQNYIKAERKPKHFGSGWNVYKKPEWTWKRSERTERPRGARVALQNSFRLYPAAVTKGYSAEANRANLFRWQCRRRRRIKRKAGPGEGLQLLCSQFSLSRVPLLSSFPSVKTSYSRSAVNNSNPAFMFNLLFLPLQSKCAVYHGNGCNRKQPWGAFRGNRTQRLR